MVVPMRLPDLATNDDSVTVVRWLVAVGGRVRRGEPIAEVETDKAVMTLESAVTGTVRALAVAPGGRAAIGEVVAVFDVEEGAPAPAGPVAAPAAAREVARETRPGQAPVRPRVSFFERNRRARGASSPEVVPLSVARRTLARKMRESKQTVPHFYLQASADAGPMGARRAATEGRKPAWDAFFVHAAGKALRRFDRMCYRFEDDQLVCQRVDAVAVAVDLDGELFAVAIDRPADRPPEAISEEIRASVEQLRGGDPRARTVRRADLTVSNLGATGVEAFAAVITPPESAALAVGAVRPVVVARDGRPVVEDRVALTLSVDHRVVNGKYAAGFLAAIVEEIEAF
jgi:pyruvate dehydrogenase E2 component (dihydrolipoamide acetyltransferase)